MASILLFLFLLSFGQTNLNSDEIDTKSIIKVTLLGTGTPQPILERFGASILVQAGGKNLLFDAGRGCLQRLQQIGVEYNTLDGVFFTHLHSDHIVGFPDLWLTGWLVFMSCMQWTSDLQLTGFSARSTGIRMLQENLYGRGGIILASPRRIMIREAPIAVLLTWRDSEKTGFICTSRDGDLTCQWLTFSLIGTGLSGLGKSRRCMYLHQAMKLNYS